MGGMNTGDVYSQEEFDAMPIAEREEKQLVPLNAADLVEMHGMNRAQRRAWMKKNKKFKGSAIQ